MTPSTTENLEIYNSTLFLFGSLARNDHVRESDVDLLMIGDVDTPRHTSIGQLSLFLYPWSKLEQEAKDGNLFVCHLTREAKALFDPHCALAQLRNIFQLRSDYQREIAQATDLGWYLVRFGDDLNLLLQSKRTLWCMRTILIARSAETGAPVFAPELLAARTKSKNAQDLITKRHEKWDKTSLRESLRQFLQTETATEAFYHDAEKSAYLERFKESSNDVALRTLQQSADSNSIYT